MGATLRGRALDTLMAFCPRAPWSNERSCKSLIAFSPCTKAALSGAPRQNRIYANLLHCKFSLNAFPIEASSYWIHSSGRWKIRGLTWERFFIHAKATPLGSLVVLSRTRLHSTTCQQRILDLELIKTLLSTTQKFWLTDISPESIIPHALKAKLVCSLQR